MIIFIIYISYTILIVIIVVVIYLIHISSPKNETFGSYKPPSEEPDMCMDAKFNKELCKELHYKKMCSDTCSTKLID